MAPWPFDLRETHLLFWAESDFLILEQMKALGTMPSNALNWLRLPVVATGTRQYLMIQSSAAVFMPPTSSRDIPRTAVQRDSSGYPEFQQWLDEAVVIDTENQELVECMRLVLGSATSWLQVFKAFPEVLEILVGATRNTMYPSRARDFYTLDCLSRLWGDLQSRDLARTRAHTLDFDLRQRVERGRDTALRICAQATLLNPEMAGRLDDSPFAHTWFS